MIVDLNAVRKIERPTNLELIKGKIAEIYYDPKLNKKVCKILKDLNNDEIISEYFADNIFIRNICDKNGSVQSFNLMFIENNEVIDFITGIDFVVQSKSKE